MVDVRDLAIFFGKLTFVEVRRRKVRLCWVYWVRLVMGYLIFAEHNHV